MIERIEKLNSIKKKAQLLFKEYLLAKKKKDYIISDIIRKEIEDLDSRGRIKIQTTKNEEILNIGYIDKEGMVVSRLKYMINKTTLIEDREHIIDQIIKECFEFPPKHLKCDRVFNTMKFIRLLNKYGYYM